MKKAVITLLLFAMAFSAGFSYAQSRKLGAQIMQQNMLESTSMNETRATQEPAMYASNEFVYKAYQIAKEIPELIDKVFCYCYCAMNPKFKHKSLLTCYVDSHASQCGICMRQTFGTKRMAEEGKSSEEIAKVFRDMYLK